MQNAGFHSGKSRSYHEEKKDDHGHHGHYGHDGHHGHDEHHRHHRHDEHHGHHVHNFHADFSNDLLDNISGTMADSEMSKFGVMGVSSLPAITNTFNNVGANIGIVSSNLRASNLANNARMPGMIGTRGPHVAPVQANIRS